MKIKDNLNSIKSCLPFSLRGIFDIIPKGTQEIRLRINQPIAIQTPYKTYFVNNSFRLSEKPSDNPLIVTQREISEAFSTICNYSVYSKQSEIINGFITLKGGNRAGICGTAVIQDDRIINIRDITSINLRVTRELIGCAEKFLDFYNQGGMLLCGAPCSGKTTILRDLARTLSYEHKTTLIDTRSELAAVYGGIAQNDVGLCDVLNSYPKSTGFEHAVRCLSPELIVCDEIGGEDDALSVLKASKSGVSVIASAHCSSKSELIENRYLKALLEPRVFNKLVFLDSGRSVGQIREVFDIDELL